MSITELYCFAVYDTDGEEGLLAFRDRKLGYIPMTGADCHMVEHLMPAAQGVADEMQKPVRIYKFTNKEQIGEIMPRINVKME